MDSKFDLASIGLLYDLRPLTVGDQEVLATKRHYGHLGENSGHIFNFLYLTPCSSPPKAVLEGSLTKT